MFNLNQLDLNLVRVFVAVVETRNITRAGEKLGLSQSAVSHALNRLRQICNDPLFLRTPSEMRPTPLALGMASRLAAALAEVEAAFGPPEFDPRRSDLQFSIALTDYIATAIFPGLFAQIRDQNLTISVFLRSINELNVSDELDLGRLHLAIGVFRKPAARFLVEPIATFDNVWVMRGGHPAAEALRAQAGPLDLETLAKFPHLEVCFAERAGQEDFERDLNIGNVAQLESLLAQKGLKRRIGAVTSHLTSVAPLLARSDMLAFIPSPMAREFARAYGLVAFRPPYPAEPTPLSLIFHRTLGAHPAVVWLRRQLHEHAVAAFSPPRGLAGHEITP
ncbi:MAG TPA: LysR family transcriptional regulator [Rhodoblastus sp.]|nr:LysR family transcriptional regulator [Rhodoblastus sp.]